VNNWVKGILAAIGAVVVVSFILSHISSGGGSACNDSSCVISTVQQSLVGGVAKDESVMTKLACRQSTVVQNPGDTWTVQCTATYSDGTRYAGYATLLPSQDKATWEPTGPA
jgi:hypothetical protein